MPFFGLFWGACCSKKIKKGTSLNARPEKGNSMKLATMFKRTVLFTCIATMLLLLLAGCGGGDAKEKIVIYSSNEDYQIEFMQDKLNEKFPNYDISFEYKSSGDHAAALKATGKDAPCDISIDIEYGYAAQIAALGYFADLTDITDFTVFTEDAVQSKYYVPELRNGGCIAVNLDRLEALGLEKPTSYEDLLDPQYKGHISMPNPASSGTGYMFLLSLVNAWGEERALAYFDQLAPNMQSFTASGSGPISALAQGEVAVAFGMTTDAVTQKANGTNLEILFFEPGSPNSLYGTAIIAGKEERACVVEVFRYLTTELNQEIRSEYFPEKIYKDKDFKQEGFPENVPYADMKVENPGTYKEELLKKWKH